MKVRYFDHLLLLQNCLFKNLLRQLFAVSFYKYFSKMLREVLEYDQFILHYNQSILHHKMQTQWGWFSYTHAKKAMAGLENVCSKHAFTVYSSDTQIIPARQNFWIGTKTTK